MANKFSYDISAYTVNSATGAITEIAGSPFSTLETNAGVQLGTNSVVVDPSARFLYAANIQSDSVSVYSINPVSGALTQIAGSPFATGDGPYEITIDPSGRYAYVVTINDDSITGYSIDPSSGALTELASSPIAGGNAPISLDVDPSGRFLYTANASLTSNSYWVSGYAIDPNTGALTELTGSPYDTVTGYGPISIDVDPLGEFVYVANLTNNNVKLFTIDTDTGVLSGGGTVVTGNNPQCIHIDPTGRYVYTANGASHDVSGFSINAANGSLTEIQASPMTTGGSGPFSITTIAAYQ